jgi:N-acetyl-anhydromuramyl-L-alanine amidase AmpD
MDKIKKISLLIALLTSITTVTSESDSACSEESSAREPIQILRTTGKTGPRIARGTGELRKPTMISLVVAGKNLAKVLESTRGNIFYNLIIDLTHEPQVYFSTNTESHSIFDACEVVRSHAVGVSAFIDHGYLQRRDINSEAVTVGLVGKPSDFLDTEKYNFFAETLEELCAELKISRHRVVSYPMIAVYPNGTHGRASTERNNVINFEQLAHKYGFGLWPEETSEQIDPFFSAEESVRWTAQALNKLGMVAAVTGNNDHPQIRSAIATFQQHYQLDLADGIVNIRTINALNSLLEEREVAEPGLEKMEPPTLKKYYNRKRRECKPMVLSMVARLAKKCIPISSE